MHSPVRVGASGDVAGPSALSSAGGGGEHPGSLQVDGSGHAAGAVHRITLGAGAGAGGGGEEGGPGGGGVGSREETAPMTVKPYYSPVARIDEAGAYALLRWLHKDQQAIKGNR